MIWMSEIVNHTTLSGKESSPLIDKSRHQP